MSKKLKMMLTAMVFLFPCAARADIDFASIIQDKLSTVEEEVNKVLKQYTNIQVHIQEFRNNRDILGTLKGYAMQEIDARKAQLMDKVRSMPLSVQGIKAQLNMGDIAGAGLISTVKSKYTKKTGANDDVAKAQEHHKMMNKLLIENLTTLYARALVHRKAMQDENKTLDKEKQEQEKLFQDSKSDTDKAQLGPLKDAYQTVKTRANERWRTILSTTADYKGLTLNGMIAESRISSEEEAIAELQAAQAAEEAAAQAEEEAAAAQTPTFSFNGPTVGQVMDLGTQGLNDAQRGDWWSLINTAGGGYGTMAGQSSVSDIVAAGAGTASDIGRNLQDGNVAGAFQSMASGSGNIGSITGIGEFNDVGQVIGGGLGLATGDSDDVFGIIDNTTNVLNGASGQNSYQQDWENHQREEEVRRQVLEDWQRTMREMEDENNPANQLKPEER